MKVLKCVTQAYVCVHIFFLMLPRKLKNKSVFYVYVIFYSQNGVVSMIQKLYYFEHICYDSLLSRICQAFLIDSDGVRLY